MDGGCTSIIRSGAQGKHQPQLNSVLVWLVIENILAAGRSPSRARRSLDREKSTCRSIILLLSKLAVARCARQSKDHSNAVSEALFGLLKPFLNIMFAPFSKIK